MVLNLPLRENKLMMAGQHRWAAAKCLEGASDEPPWRRRGSRAWCRLNAPMARTFTTPPFNNLPEEGRKKKKPTSAFRFLRRRSTSRSSALGFFAEGRRVVTLTSTGRKHARSILGPALAGRVEFPHSLRSLHQWTVRASGHRSALDDPCC